MHISERNHDAVRGYRHVCPPRMVVMTAHGHIKVINAALSCVGWSESRYIMAFLVNTASRKLHPLREISWIPPRRL